jgi:hypothetical protein
MSLVSGTGVGVVRGSVSPSPSCPKSFWPQQRIVLSVIVLHACVGPSPMIASTPEVGFDAILSSIRWKSPKPTKPLHAPMRRQEAVPRTTAQRHA